MELGEKNKQINEVIQHLENKDFSLYFFVLDTMGNPTAGIANVYENVKILNNLGYNAVILHEKDEYTGVSSWLGEEYMKLPHTSITSQSINIKSSDFIIIPEVFANVMDQVKAFPCKKIVMAQSYNYIFELLQPGKKWNTDFGFNDVITTSEKQGEYLKSIFSGIKTHVIPVSIPEYFKDTKKIKIPVIAIHTRDQSDALKIAKSFYLQYPAYKWVTFKELRGLPRTEFAKELSEACLAVWVDDVSGFGTFPLEAIQSNTPVIGKIPNLVPEWMEIETEGVLDIKDNGIWTNNVLNIPELIATYIKLWMEDSIPNALYEGMETTKNIYTTDNQTLKVKEVFEGLVSNRIKDFERMLESEELNLEKND